MRPRKLFLLLALLALLTACRDAAVSPRDASSETHPAVDLVIHNARIYTVNQHQPWSQAVAIKNGKFVRLGKDSELAALPARRRLDLQQRLLLPAMVDGHSHPGYVSVEDFGEVNGETPEALLSSVKKYADQHPEQKWLRLCCWPTTMFVKGDQGPKKEVLDAILPDRLVWFESETAHDFWLNSAALAELGVSRKTPDPKPGLAMYARDKNGDPTGWVKEGAGV